MIEAMLWKPLREERVQCGLCAHFCIIELGKRGLCGVRENRNGRLFSLVADRIPSANIDPVEKKPLFHFYPGTRTFSFGTQGCNLSCTFCQNHTLSQSPKLGQPISGQKAGAEDIVRAALESSSHSISYTYSEPTVFFEIVYETAKLASAKGLKNILVSNGFQSPECLDMLAPYIHAANIDLKAFTEDFYRTYCYARLEPVKKNLKHILKLGWWLEITTLVIPTLNDSPEELEAISGFIAGELSVDVPWHVSRFHPQYKMQDKPPTPTASLETALILGKNAGLKYVYTGNIPGHAGEVTKCPGCNQTLIERVGYRTEVRGLVHGRCAYCGETIAGRWNP